jgi:hypothetical protein
VWIALKTRKAGQRYNAEPGLKMGRRRHQFSGDPDRREPLGKKASTASGICLTAVDYSSPIRSRQHSQPTYWAERAGTLRPAPEHTGGHRAMEDWKATVYAIRNLRNDLTTAAPRKAGSPALRPMRICCTDRITAPDRRTTNRKRTRAERDPQRSLWSPSWPLVPAAEKLSRPARFGLRTIDRGLARDRLALPRPVSQTGIR